MLARLEISNFLFIEKAIVEFSPKVNVITGETGAGKSLFLSALKAVFGEKIKGGANTTIRLGADEAVLRSVFFLKNKAQRHSLMKILHKWDILIHDGDDQQLNLSRNLRRNGSDTCFIDKREVPHELLSQLAPLLLDIHSQRQNQYLLKSENHLHFYDSYLRLAPKRKAYRHVFRDLQEQAEKLKTFQQTTHEDSQQKEFLNYTVSELSKALKHIGDYSGLKQKLSALEQAQRLSEEAMHFDAVKRNQEKNFQEMSHILANIKQIPSLEATLKKNFQVHSEQIEDLQVKLSSQLQTSIAMLSLKDYKSEIDEIQGSLANVEALERKYKTSATGLSQRLQEAEKKLARLAQASEGYSKLKKSYEEAYTKAYALAAELHEKRIQGLQNFYGELQHEIEGLGMSGGRIEVRIKPDIKEKPSKNMKLQATGFTKVELYYAASPEMQAKPFRQIASGGELSRMMLALKSMLATQLLVSVIVFDEIDSGVGGKTALLLASRLKRLATTKQLLVITHLPQIARSADSHFTILKSLLEKEKKTITSVLHLDSFEKRLAEICRMLGRSVSKENIAFAKKFMDGEK